MLSCCLAHLENARGGRHATSDQPSNSWVRTIDGWEHREMLWLERCAVENPALHPLLVATFQLSASLFVLTAFPGAARPKNSYFLSQAAVVASVGSN